MSLKINAWEETSTRFRSTGSYCNLNKKWSNFWFLRIRNTLMVEASKRHCKQKFGTRTLIKTPLVLWIRTKMIREHWTNPTQNQQLFFRLKCWTPTLATIENDAIFHPPSGNYENSCFLPLCWYWQWGYSLIRRKKVKRENARFHSGSY